ncbi:carbohydrate-binding protein [Flagellimonas sp.]|uniref:carbohydrate-binding protein n=1 Tax=Flagellimonas sp. TaxID=2058762 RepID=UPI003B5009CE
MKTRKQLHIKTIFSLLVFMAFLSCERELSNDAEFATFSTTGEVFTDLPIGLGSDFYFPFLGSKATAFSVDQDVAYESDASMRFDVPNANDPDGNFAGAIFRIEGSGRNLTEFDALTFWAKASQGVNIGEIGFGQDFGENKFQTTRTNVSLGTQWAKYVIPIPDPSKLTEERGMLWYSAGTNETGGFGYTFWLDEVKFEKLGNIAQAKPAILNGVDVAQDAFINIPITLTGLTQTFSTASGNVTVNTTPAYFDFQSTNIDVARANELGVVSVVGTGEATITASLANVAAAGSLALDVSGTFDFAPTPPARNPEDVISIFSDAYTNVAVDYYNGFFADGFQTTEGGAPPIDVNGDMIINYTVLNFVGIGTFQDVAPVNITDMTHIHVDIKVNEGIDPGDFIRLQLLNSVGNNETSGDYTIDGSALAANDWVSLDIPLADFNGLGDRSQIGLLFFISDATIADIFVDNIYYYR